MLANAESRLGERQHDQVFSSCEQFAKWCIDSEHRSDQVTAGGAAAGAIAAGAANIPSAGLWGLLGCTAFCPVMGAGLVMGGLALGAAIVEKLHHPSDKSQDNGEDH